MAKDQGDEEYSKLAEQVQQVEKVLSLPGKAGEVGYLLKAFLLNAKTRMESIKGEVTTAKEHEKMRRVGSAKLPSLRWWRGRAD